MEYIENKEFKLPHPEPLFKELEQAKDYPLQAFGKYAEVLESIEDITQAPIAFAGQSFLAVASLCVQDIANVETIGGGHCPLSLYLLTLGVSGERKSSCDKLLMKAIIDLQKDLSKETRQRIEAYKIEKEIWRKNQGKLIKNGKSKSDISELGAEPTEPTEQLITISDPTIEGIFDLLEVGRPQGDCMSIIN